MNRSLLLGAVGLSAAIGCLFAPIGLAHEGHDHPEPDAEQMHPNATEADEHDHGTLEIPAGQPVPTVNLVVHPDAHQGWNLEVQVTNFTFAPEHVNQANLAAEGHAHLYLDGVKLTRLYGNWYYLESLAPGSHEITVALNANGHEALTHNGEAIESTVTIEVPE